ncbi:hypothetical protein [Armatimonas sp.]|uniref:hypothetical protein n=1 Tax=Armatimonas sp. TaxID=1872638 RepID=UPI0037503EAB
MEEDDEIQLLLGLQYEGLETAKSYALVLREVVRAEAALARSVGKTNESYTEAAKVRAQAMSAMPAAAGGMPAAPVNNFGTAQNARKEPSAKRENSEPKEKDPSILGPNARYQKAYLQYEWARKSGNGAQQEDTHINLARATKALESGKHAAMTPQMQALYSTRINLPGGAAPLLGKSLDAAVGPAATRGILAGLAPLAKLVAPLAKAFLIAKIALGAFEMAVSAAAEGARVTNALTSAQATSGGSVADAARVGLVGGSAGAARSLQERITTDPQAMQSAARIGIHNLKGQYGNLDWTGQYLKAIEETSKVGDERLRRQLSITLGIEQEVARYALLSEETRRGIKEQARVTGQINDPKAQALAAEFDTAQKSQAQAVDNFKSAVGQLFSDDITGLFNEATKVVNGIALFIKGLRGNNRHYDTFLGALTGGLLGDAGHDGAGKQKQSPVMSNTLALQANTSAMNRLNTNIGLGAYGREALPSPLQGQQLHEAMVSRSLRIGALG